MRIIIAIIFVPAAIFSQQLAFSFSVDTLQYENCGFHEYIVRSPNVYTEALSSPYRANDLIVVCKKKNADQYDLFSLSGKLGSIIIPSSATPMDYKIEQAVISQAFIDNDSAWEAVVSYFPIGSSYVNLFKVIDDNGNILLSDTGKANIGYDGSNTYVFGYYNLPIKSFKAWKFRALASGLSKSVTGSSGIDRPFFLLDPSGNLDITLQPSSDGQIAINVFDMLGRCLFSKTVASIKSPIRITVPSTDISNSPVVTRIQSGSEVFIKKTISVR